MAGGANGDAGTRLLGGAEGSSFFLVASLLVGSVLFIESASDLSRRGVASAADDLSILFCFLVLWHRYRETINVTANKA